MLALPRIDGRKSRRPWGDVGVDTRWITVKVWSPSKITLGSHARISPDSLKNTTQVMGTGRENSGCGLQGGWASQVLRGQGLPVARC